MIGKRDFLKGAMGAAAALNAKPSPYLQPEPPTIPYPDSNFTRQAAENLAARGLDFIPDPLLELKQLWFRNAAKERELLYEQLERKSASLARLRSVSDAYKFHMLEVYRKERQTINQRFEDFCNKIWGGPSNGPVGR